MTAGVAAGVSCCGPPHKPIEWRVTADRRLNLGAQLTDRQAWALKSCPIPGTSPVMAVDVGRLAVLLANGEGWRLDYADTPRWREVAPAMEANDMKASKLGEPAVLAAGVVGGVVWFATPDRRLWTWNAAGGAPLVDAPLPGTARILAVDVAQRTVLTDDGARMQWLGGRWVKLGPLGEGAAVLRVRALSGFCAGGALGDVYEGQELELPEAEARQLIASGRATVAA